LYGWYITLPILDALVPFLQLRLQRLVRVLEAGAGATTRDQPVGIEAGQEDVALVLATLLAVITKRVPTILALVVHRLVALLERLLRLVFVMSLDHVGSDVSHAQVVLATSDHARTV